MSDSTIKPLNWTPTPGIGYTVTRRPDGGMYYVFTDASHTTLSHWRAFAEAHLLESDRLTTNLYDLRQIAEIPAEALQYALELNNDPSTRHIRLAVVVANDKVRQAVQEIGALTAGGGAEIAIFTNIDEAEAWLNRPLTIVV